MEKLQKQIMAFLRGFTAGQAILLLGSAAIVGIAVWFFVRLIGAADYKPLYTGLSSADAQTITQSLAAQSIQYQVSSDGTTVLVPTDQLDKARLQVASQGPLATGRIGFELFDKPNWSGSDFSEKVNYQRALEAELERTISTMNGVEAVRVHLVLPHDSLFTDRERPAKAAVVLKLRGLRMSDQVANSIANLVSSAWDDLSPQNVSVITTDGQMPAGGHGEQGVDTPAGMADLETAMAEKVVQVLTPIVGADHVKSSVTIEYDPTSGESTQETFDPNATAVVSSQISQENAADLEPSGIPGTPTNAPNAPPQGAAAQAAAQAKSDQSSEGIRSENKTFVVSHTTHHLIEPPGRIKRIAAAVLVDDAVETQDQNGKQVATHRKRTPDEMKQIEDLAKASLGWDSMRGDQISVQEVSFQTPQEEAPTPPTLPQRVRVITEQWTGLLRYVALFALFVLVYFLILNPVKKRVLAVLDSTELRVSTGRASAPALATAGAAAAIPGSVQAPGLTAAQTAAGAGAVLPEAGTESASDFTRALALKQQIVTKVKTDPENASKTVQNWVRGAQA